jgi:hypothetical protein
MPSLNTFPPLWAVYTPANAGEQPAPVSRNYSGITNVRIIRSAANDLMRGMGQSFCASGKYGRLCLSRSGCRARHSRGADAELRDDTRPSRGQYALAFADSFQGLHGRQVSSRGNYYEPCFSRTISAFLRASFSLRKARATSPRGVSDGGGEAGPNSHSGRSPWA